MTTRDKTRDKLVGSMRKTKDEAGGKKDGTGPASATPAGTKTTARSRNTGRTKRDRQSDASPTLTSAGIDSYQSGGRVWPD